MMPPASDSSGARRPAGSSWVDALRTKDVGAGVRAGALEAKGDRSMARGRRQLSGLLSYCIAPELNRHAMWFFKEAAEAFVLANNWRKAALAHREIAICRMKIGRNARLYAADSLLDCAYCYKKVLDPDDKEMVNAMEWALKNSLGMYVLENVPESAASVCSELAMLYASLKQWQKVGEYYERALYASLKQWQKVGEYYERAVYHYADTNNPFCTEYATMELHKKLSLLMEETQFNTYLRM